MLEHNSRFIRTSNEITTIPTKSHEKGGVDILFLFFCVWLFVLLCRPQDIVSVLAPLRPALLVSIVVFVLLIFRINYLNQTPFFQEIQNKLYTALIIIMILSIPFALYRRLSFDFFFKIYSAVVLFYYLFYKLVDSVGKLRTIILLGCVGNGLYLLYSISAGEMVGGRLFFSDMFDANDLAFFALSFLPLNLIFISKDNPVLIRVACSGFFATGTLLILLTGSRGGFLAFLIVMAMALFTKSLIIKRAVKVIGALLFVVIFTFSPANVERFKTIITYRYDYNFYDETGRVAIWKSGLRIMFENPITGSGVLNFSQALGMERQKRDAETLRWQAPHNMIIQVGAETGVIGMVLFVLISLNVFRIMKRARKESASVQLARVAEMGRLGFLGLFVSGMFLSQAYSIYWAFYVAFSAIVSKMLQQERIS